MEHRDDHDELRGCADWRATRRQALGRAADAVPLPADALDGLAEFSRSGGLTRRNLFERGVGLWVGASLLGGLSARSLLEAAAAEAAEAPSAPILVSLYLDGGNDGLNTLVPLADGRYPVLRGRLRVAPESTLPLAGVADFGWHPALGGLRELYDQGKVAVLPSVDFLNADQSHFNSVAYWRRGIVGPSRVITGWMGRTLDATGSRSNPLQGVSVSWSPDPVLDSRRAPVATVLRPDSYNFHIQGVWRGSGFERAYREASGGASRSPALTAARRAYRNAFTIQDRLAPLRAEGDGAAPAVAYPDSRLGERLRNLARMLGAGFGTRFAAVSTGGFDTHDHQDAEHPALLQDLGDCLRAWQADLSARGLGGRVLTLVWSEFGRRPRDNDSNGTDHGAGGLVMVVGDRANGGIRTEFPGLARLDEDDNLRVTTDFRTVYASLLEQWMGVEAGRVLPRIPGGRIPLVA